MRWGCGAQCGDEFIDAHCLPFGRVRAYDEVAQFRVSRETLFGVTRCDGQQSSALVLGRFALVQDILPRPR
jgi:hypothetical protein